MALWHPAYLNHALLMQDWCHDLLLTFFWHCTCANLICCEEYVCVIIFCCLLQAGCLTGICLLYGIYIFLL